MNEHANQLIDLLSRHTDEDQADVLHTLIMANQNDGTLLDKIANALHATNVIRADGTESPTIN